MANGKCADFKSNYQETGSFLFYLIHPPGLPFEMRGDKLFEGHAIQDMLDAVLGGRFPKIVQSSVTDEGHD